VRSMCLAWRVSRYRVFVRCAEERAVTIRPGDALTVSCASAKRPRLSRLKPGPLAIYAAEEPDAALELQHISVQAPIRPFLNGHDSSIRYAVPPRLGRSAVAGRCFNPAPAMSA
jgi:hypothetical protein